MNSAVAVEAYFAGMRPATEHEIRSADGSVHWQVTSYLALDRLPPLEHVRSVRCVVLRENAVLALTQGESAHVLPGGRREPGETLLQTLERELGEETGWSVSPPRLIGVTRIHWLSALPETWTESTAFFPDFL